MWIYGTKIIDNDIRGGYHVSIIYKKNILIKYNIGIIYSN